MELLSSVLVAGTILCTRILFWDGKGEIQALTDVIGPTRSYSPTLKQRLETRIASGRLKSFKAVATTWGLSADIFFLTLYLAKDEDISLVRWLATPHIVLGFITTAVMRFCSRPSFEMREAYLEKILILLSVCAVAGQSSMPKELLPCLSTCRTLISVMFVNIKVAVWTHILLAPLSVSITIANASDVGSSFILLTLLNDFLFLTFTILATSFFHITIMEKDMSNAQMEAKTQEAEASVTAAQKLLNVTCDACVRLTEGFTIRKPEKAFLQILSAREEEVSDRSFLDFISPTDRCRFTDVMSTAPDSPASCLSLQLHGKEDRVSDVTLYHVQIPVSDPFTEEVSGQHLIGITHAAGGDFAARPPVKEEVELQEGEDMRFLLGHSQLVHEVSEVCWAQVQGLEEVVVRADAMSPQEGYQVRSVQFHFEKDGDPSALPNLLEWVLPSARPGLSLWIQDTVNALANGKNCLHELQCPFMDPLQKGSIVCTVLASNFIVDDEPDEEEESYLLELCMRDLRRSS